MSRLNQIDIFWMNSKLSKPYDNTTSESEVVFLLLPRETMSSLVPPETMLTGARSRDDDGVGEPSGGGGSEHGEESVGWRIPQIGQHVGQG